MRVIAGKAKGRKLVYPIDPKTRPIMDRVKTAVFDTLMPFLQDAIFLDLFAGTGGIGIEALSRGASEAIFVEIQQANLEYIKKNLEHTQLDTQAKVIYGDAFALLKEGTIETKLHRDKVSIDIVYIAPPQYHELALRACVMLDTSSIVKLDGMIVVQIHPHERAALLAHTYTTLILTDERKYGNTLILYFRKRDQKD